MKRLIKFVTVKTLGIILICIMTTAVYGAVTPNGAFVHSIPIEVPPGLNGIQPTLAVEYNSSSVGTDSYVGMSWRLSGLSEIRRVNIGNGIKYAGQDSFMSPEGLLVSNGDGSYSSLNQNFSRYVPQGQCGDSFCSWVVYLANGAKQYYGSSLDSRIVATEHPASVRVWAISKTENPQGLYWEAEYTNYGDGNYYPLRISYTKGAGSYYHVIKFEYITRSDFYVQYTTSGSISTTRILSAIQINSDCMIDYCVLGKKVSRLEFQYQQSQNLNVSKLISYSKYAYDQNNNIDSNLTQAQNFTYAGDDMNIPQHSVLGGSYQNTGYCNLLGYPANCTDYLEPFSNNPVTLIDPRETWILADIDGDGRQDPTYASHAVGGIACRFPKTYGAFVNWEQRWGGFPGFPYGMPNPESTFVRSGNLNRDLTSDLIGFGRAKPIVMGAPWRLIITTATSDAEGQQNGTGSWSRGDVFGNGNTSTDRNFRYTYQLTSWTPYWDSASETFQLSDIDGDGQSDIYYLYKLPGGQVRINMLISKGDGTFIEKTLDSPLISTWDVNTSNWQFGDYDGDGKGDLLLLINAGGFLRANFAFSNGDGTFRYVTTDTALSAHWDNANDVFRSGDINADGKTDIFFITNQNGNAKVNTLISKGNGQFEIISQDTALTPTWNNLTSLWFPVDINADGRTDLYFLLSVGGQLRLHTFISKGNGSYVITSTDTGIYPHWDNVQERWFSSDINGDGAIDLQLIYSDTYASNPSMYGKIRIFSVISNFAKPPLTKIQDNNATINITYSMKADVPNAIQPTLKACGLNQAGPVCGASNPIPQQLVVSESVTADGITKSKSYQYSNARMFFGDILHTADAGFEWVKETDDQSGSTVQTYYNQTKPFLGIPVKTVTTAGNGLFQSIQLQSDLRQYVCNDSGCTRNDAADLMQPHLIRIANQQQDTVDDKGVHITKIKQVTGYDSFGNETSSTQTISGNGVSKVSAVESTYINMLTPTVRFLAVPTLQKSCIGNDCSGLILSQTRNSYDNQTFGQLGNVGLLTKKESWLFDDTWLAENYMYDNVGNLTQVSGPSNITKTIEYDTDYNAYPIKTTVTSQGSSRINLQEFDPRFGVQNSQTDAAGVKTSKVFDGKGRVVLIEIKDEHGILLRKTTNMYHLDTPGDRYAETCQFYLSDFSAQSCSRKYHDGFGRVIREVTPAVQGSQTGFTAKITTYDIQGRKASESEVLPALDITGHITPTRFTLYAYDPLNRVIKVTTPDGKIVTRSYNADLIAGAISSETSTAPDGTIKKTYSNVDGNPLRVINAFGTGQQGSVDYSYDALGRPVSVVSPTGTTVIGYDPQYRWQSYVDDPNVGRTSYTYVTDITSQAYGKILTETRPDGNSTTFGATTVTNFTYADAWGRLTEIVRADGRRTQYTYDETDMSYGFGELTTRTHLTGGYTLTDRFAFTPLGEQKVATRTVSHSSLTLCSNPNDLPCSSVLSAETDELGRTTKVGYPDGQNTVMTYFGSTSAINTIAHGPKTYATYTDFNQWGKPETITYGNGIIHTYTHEPTMGALTEVSLDRNSENIAGFKYCYDQSYNITRLVNTVVPGNTMDYRYDSLQRLSGSNRGNPQQDCSAYAGQWKTYSFDAGGANGSAGNLVTKNNRKLLYQSGHFQPSGDQVWDTATSSWKENQTFTWTIAGNLLSKGTAAYQYDSTNMLSHASEPTTGESDFYYDAEGQRFLKVFKKAGEAAIRTWYVGGGVEVRQRVSEDLTSVYAYQISKYVFSPEGHKIASITGGVNQPLAAASNRFTMMARAFGSDSVAGVAGKVQFTFYALIHDDSARQKAWIALLLILAGLLAFYLMRSWSTQIGNNIADHGVFFRALSLSFGLIFISVNINCVGRSDVEMNPIFQSGGMPAGATDFTSLYAGLPSGTYYYHPDQLGSGSMITNEAGAEVLRIVYDVYGNIDQFASGKLNPDTGEIEHEVGNLPLMVLAAKFTGQEYDPETGFYYYNARYYDPNMGQFTTPDTEIPDPSDSQGYNRYMYVKGNPIKYSDPTGHFWFLVPFIVAAVQYVANHWHEITQGSSGRQADEQRQRDSGNSSGNSITFGVSYGGGGQVSAVTGANGVTSSTPIYNPPGMGGTSPGTGLGGTGGEEGDCGLCITSYVFGGRSIASVPYSGNLYASNNDRRVLNDADPLYALETPGDHAQRQANIDYEYSWMHPPRAVSGEIRSDVETIAAILSGFGALFKGGGALIGRNAPKVFNWAQQSGILRDAIGGKGNFGLGSSGLQDALRLGESWVGSGARSLSNGKGMISQDGLRVFRYPSYKPNLNKIQGNFERYLPGSRRPIGNGHLDIIP